MSKHRNSLLLAGAILAIVLPLAVTSPHQQQEPSYAGRTYSEWLNRIQRGQWKPWEVEPILAIGTNGFPSYLKWISFQESPLRTGTAKLLQRVSPGYSWFLAVHPGQLANRVVAIFEILGPQAHTAIPELSRLARTSRDPARARRCLDSLGLIGPDAIPSILTLATNGPPQLRCLAIWKLADFGPNDVTIVPTLRLLLTDPDPNVADAASRVLRQVAPEALTNTPPH